MKLIHVGLWHYDVVDEGDVIKSFKQEYQEYVDDDGMECSRGLSDNQIKQKAQEFITTQSQKKKKETTND